MKIGDFIAILNYLGKYRNIVWSLAHGSEKDQYEKNEFKLLHWTRTKVGISF